MCFDAACQVSADGKSLERLDRCGSVVGGMDRKGRQIKPGQMDSAVEP